MAVATLLLDGQGLTGYLDPEKTPTGSLSQAENVDYSYGHMVQKEGGTVKFNATAISGGPTILAGFDYWPTASVQRSVIATGDGKLFKDNMTGAYATTLKTGLTTNLVTQMCEGGAEIAGNNKKLFFVNGGNPVQVLSGDGATTSDIATPPSDWSGANQPSFMFSMRNRLAAGGNTNDPHRLYLSSTTSHEDYSGAGGGLSLSVFPGEGQKLVAGLTAFGRTWVWKYPAGIYYVIDDDTTPGNWFIRRVTNQYGAADTPHSVIQIDQNTLAFLSSAGDVILMKESSGSLTGVEFHNLTKDLSLRTYIQNNFDLSRLNKSQLRWYPDKMQLHLLTASIGATAENRRIITDFAGENPRVHISTKDTNTAMWMVLDSSRIARPFIGDNLGFVRKIDQADRTLADGSAYTMAITTVPTDFSDIDPNYGVKKLFYRLYIEFEPTVQHDVTAEVLIDGNAKGAVTFNTGIGGSTLPFTLPAPLSSAGITRRQRAIIGEGYYISLRIFDSTANNVRLNRAWVEFEPLEMAR